MTQNRVAERIEQIERHGDLQRLMLSSDKFLRESRGESDRLHKCAGTIRLNESLLSGVANNDEDWIEQLQGAFALFYRNATGKRKLFERLAALESQLDATRGELDVLKSEFQSLRCEMSAAVSSVKSEASGAVGESSLPEAFEITKTVFPGADVKIEVDYDPAEPQYGFVVFVVKWDGEPKEIVRKKIEWHKQVVGIPSHNSGGFRVTVYPTNES